ncbi:MAG: 3-oxoacyl-[acyl-carrier-protein] reductase [Nitrospinae bacterium]|nr:3-oxoacyl-[acyl-carrier-protein] reductase [Nitrospinota bacterium]
MALITGAARGIGRAIAEAFAREGADLFLVTRSTPLDEVKSVCEALGRRVVARQANVADHTGATVLVGDAVAQLGGLDILVNNAGITRDALLVRMKDADFDDVINTNLRGAFYLMREAAKVMMKKRWGRIINISSVVGEVGNAGQVNYAASKAGLIGMTKSAARELAPRQVTVNAIAPGFITTDMTEVLNDAAKAQLLQSIPLGRFGAPEVVAAGAVFLASGDAAYITGHTLAVNGGMAM